MDWHLKESDKWIKCSFEKFDQSPFFILLIDKVTIFQFFNASLALELFSSLCLSLALELFSSLHLSLALELFGSSILITGPWIFQFLNAYKWPSNFSVLYMLITGPWIFQFFTAYHWPLNFSVLHCLSLALELFSSLCLSMALDRKLI